MALEHVGKKVDDVMDGIVIGLAKRLKMWLTSQDLISKIMEQMTDDELDSLSFQCWAEKQGREDA